MKMKIHSTAAAESSDDDATTHERNERRETNALCVMRFGSCVCLCARVCVGYTKVKTPTPNDDDIAGKIHAHCMQRLCCNMEINAYAAVVARSSSRVSVTKLIY